MADSKLSALTEITTAARTDYMYIINGGTSYKVPISKIQTAMLALTQDTAGQISAITSKASPTVSDKLLIEDDADSNNPKSATLQSIIDLAPGEANTASSAGSGVSLFYQKTGVDLELNAIKSENSLITISLDGATHDIEVTLNESLIDHDNLTNYVANEHIDWTSDQSPTEIDINNIPDLSSLYAALAFFTDAQEWQGFISDTAQTISFDNPTRTLTIQPAVTDFSFYSNSTKYTKSSSENIQIDDTTGIVYIYYNGSTLSKTTTWTDDLIKKYAYVAAIYWDSTGSEQIYIGSEFKHKIRMDGDTHKYLHETRGFSLETGGALTNLTTTGDGSADAHAQFGVEATEAYDEDANFQHLAKGLTDTVYFYYKSGTEASPVWNLNDSANFAVITTGTGRAAYNQLSGGSWQQTEVTSGSYLLSHIFVFNDDTRKFGVIQGENEYANIAAARAGAETEVRSIILDGVPTQEFKFLATILIQTNDSYTNTVKSRLRQTDTSEDYVDLRSTEFNRGGTSVTVNDHGLLSGLPDDDHTQYALLAGRSGGQTFSGGTGTSEDITFQDNTTDNNTITLTNIIAGLVTNGDSHDHNGGDGSSIPDAALSSGATVTSAGAGDSGKLVKLDGDGNVDATALNSADIDHDSTTNFVANEHINHSSVTFSAGSGLSGGGDLTTNRSYALDINSLTEDTDPDNDADFLASYDTSGAANKKIKPQYACKYAGINAQSGTTYTLVLSDQQKTVTLSNASAITMTVPPNSSVAFPIGTTITLIQIGAGQVTVDEGVGVTVSSEGTALKLNAQYAGATLIKTGTDQWYLFGSITT